MLKRLSLKENTARAFKKGLAKISSDEHMKAMTDKTKKACVIVDIFVHVVYDRLGNGINKELTHRFIESGFDMNLLYKEVTE